MKFFVYSGFFSENRNVSKKNFFAARMAESIAYGWATPLRFYTRDPGSRVMGELWPKAIVSSPREPHRTRDS